MIKFIEKTLKMYNDDLNAKKSYTAKYATVINDEFVVTKQWDKIVEFLEKIEDYNCLELYINVTDFNYSKERCFIHGRILKKEGEYGSPNITEVLKEHKVITECDTYIMEKGDDFKETVLDYLIQMYYNSGYSVSGELKWRELIIIKG